jgi:hypothetical protein
LISLFFFFQEVGPKRPSPEDLSAYDLPEPNEAAPPPQPKRIAASPPSLREMSPPALAPARSGTKISESERDRPRTRADVASANLDVYNPPKAPGGKKEEKPPATQPPPQPKAHKPFWLAEDKSGTLPFLFYGGFFFFSLLPFPRLF